MNRFQANAASRWLAIRDWVIARGAFGMVIVVGVAVAIVISGTGVTVAVTRVISESLVAEEAEKQEKTEQSENDDNGQVGAGTADGLPDAGGPADQRVNSELANKLGHQFYTDDPWLQQTTSGVSVEFRPGGAYVKIFLACASASGGARISDGQSLNTPFACSAVGQASQSSGYYSFSCPAPRQLTVSLWGTKLDGTHVYQIPESSKQHCGPVVVEPTTPPAPEPSPEPTTPSPSPIVEPTTDPTPTSEPTPSIAE